MGPLVLTGAGPRRGAPGVRETGRVSPTTRLATLIAVPVAVALAVLSVVLEWELGTTFLVGAAAGLMVAGIAVALSRRA